MNAMVNPSVPESVEGEAQTIKGYYTLPQNKVLPQNIDFCYVRNFMRSPSPERKAMGGIGLQNYSQGLESEFPGNAKLYFTGESFTCATRFLPERRYWVAILGEDIYFKDNKKRKIRFNQGDEIYVIVKPEIDISAHLIKDLDESDFSQNVEIGIEKNKKRAKALLEEPGVGFF